MWPEAHFYEVTTKWRIPFCELTRGFATYSLFVAAVQKTGLDQMVSPESVFSPEYISRPASIVSQSVLEVEVSVGVIVGDVLDHLVDELHLALRKLSILDVLSEEVAEDSAEVLVTRI